MKRTILVGFVLLCFYNLGYSTHLFRNNAANINTGILPNARLDSSSVTLRGQLTDGLQILILASGTFRGTAFSTTGFVGGSSTFTWLNIDGLATIDTMTVYGTILSTSGFTGVGSSLTLLNATNLGLGIIPNTRQDSSSVTLQGNSFNGANQLLQAQSDGFIDDIDVDPSSITKQGNSFNGANQLVQLDGNSFVPNARIDPSSITKLGNSVIDTSASTQTKTGGIISLGNITASSVTAITTVTASGISVSTTQFNNVSYRWPSNSGSNGQILSSDGNGALSWVADSGGGTAIREYRFVIGTAASQGVDYSGTNEVPFQAAIDSAPTGSIIIVREGFYTFTRQVSISSGLHFILHSSAVITTNGTGVSAFRVNARAILEGGIFTTQAGQTVKFLETSSSATIRNIIIEPHMNSGITVGFIEAKDGSNNYLENITLRNWTTAGVAGNNRIFAIARTTDIYIRNLKTENASSLGSVNDIIVGVANSRNVYIEDCNFKNNNISVEVQRSVFRAVVRNNKFRYTGGAANTYQILFGVGSDYIDSALGIASSGCVVIGNDFVNEGSQTNSVIYMSALVDNRENTSIINNTFTGTGGGTFITVGDVNCRNTFIHGNRADGINTFLTDSGTQTKRRDNVFGGVLQTDD